jgi:HrpA-like RNA helicase
MVVFQKLRDTLKDLPVYGIIADVVKDVHAGTVTLVAARTGSGKSMMLPSALADAGDEQVVVLVPRRFLATDAACNVAELSETTLGFEVGFALGQVNDEKSLHVPDTQLLFCTYGYALRSGLINRARTLVLDEVHEGDEHISLARAVLHERKQREPDLRILEMSATVNARRQASFWQDIATTTITAKKRRKNSSYSRISARCTSTSRRMRTNWAAFSRRSARKRCARRRSFPPALRSASRPVKRCGVPRCR